MVGSKQCRKCGETKSADQFSKDSKKSDGLCWCCKACQAAYAHKRYLENKDHILEQERKWRERRPTYMRDYSLAHRKQTKTKYGVSVKTIERFGLKIVLAVYDKAGRKCQQCGEVNDLTVHHGDRNGRNNQDKGLPANNSLENLKILCRRCHGKIHSDQWYEYKRRQLSLAA